MLEPTIRLFLAHGDAKCLRTAALSSVTGGGIASPRGGLDSILTLDETTRPGVYLLTSTDPESGKPAVYVGEAECVRDRLREDLAGGSWNHVLFFISQDEDLTRSHLRYLQERLVAQIGSGGQAVVMNDQLTTSQLAAPDREKMEIFLEKICQVIPVLGIDNLLPSSPIPTDRTENQLLVCEIRGARALAYVTTRGFVVLKGSQAVLEERASARHYPHTIATRRKLIGDGTLVEEGGHLRFTRDFEFSSPSAAAAVVHGGSANGPLVWRNAAGRTLKELTSRLAARKSRTR